MRATPSTRRGRQYYTLDVFEKSIGGLSGMLLMIALAAQIAATNTKPPEPPYAEVAHEGRDWQVDYTLPPGVRAWAFPVSAPRLLDHQPWRQGNWRVRTPGVRIERHGAYDPLVADNGRTVPRRVRITFTPTSATLDQEYDPAIAFGNGAMALYSDQFDLAPVGAPTTIDVKETGLSIGDLGGRPMPVRFHDAAGPVFVRGRRQRDPVLIGAATYVVFGSGNVQTLGGVSMLSDSDLPAWLKTDVSQFAPFVASSYAARLGARADPSLPLLIMGWRGATPGKVVNDGGVRAGEIVLNFEGEGLLDRNPSVARRTRWFIAHEMAHFWLGSEGVGYAAPSDAWITEGGADMMAFTLLAASDHDYAIGELQRAVDDCVKLGGKPITRAADRHESCAFYACGTVFALAASGIARRHGSSDFFDFIRPLLIQHQFDRRLTAADWLDHVSKLEGGTAMADLMRAMIARGSSEPAKDVAAVLQMGGVPVKADHDRIIVAPTAI